MFVGIIGEAGSGKSYIAQVLQNNFKFKVYNCGDKIRALLKEINPTILYSDNPVFLSDLLVYNSWENLKNPDSIVMPSYRDKIIFCESVREELQYYGEILRKTFGEDFLVKTVYNEYIDSLRKDFYSPFRAKEYPGLVIPDMRKIGEIEFAKLQKAFILRINNNELEKKEEWRKDITENDWKKFTPDYTYEYSKKFPQEKIIENMKEILAKFEKM